MTAMRDHSSDPSGQGVEWDRDKKLSQAQQIATLRAEVSDLKAEVHELTASVQGLVDAWNAAKFVTAIIKWLAAIGVAIVSIKAGLQAFRTGSS